MADEKKKVKKVVVNRDLCIGAASCIVNAPGVFELDAENKAVMKLDKGAKSSGPSERKDLEDKTIDDETIINAAQSCPTKAIFVYDEDGKQIYP
ncbi:MAG: ferredoxin [Candidatus Kerfeldbacteria bacterium]